LHLQVGVAIVHRPPITFISFRCKLKEGGRQLLDLVPRLKDLLAANDWELELGT